MSGFCISVLVAQLRKGVFQVFNQAYINLFYLLPNLLSLRPPPVCIQKIWD